MFIEPLPYFRHLVEYLRLREPRLWEWYEASQHREEAADEVRLALLKSTYRLDREEHKPLYELAEVAAERVEVDAPLTLYQSQDINSLNAALARFPDEAHVILSGPIRDKLSEDEIIALFGHELSHHRLFSDWDQQYLVADQILAALTNASSVVPSHLATSRLFQLYSEVFCDRGALQSVNGDLTTVVSLLVRMETGGESIGPESFLAQVDELFEADRPTTEGVDHPEAFIRARSLQLWSNRDDSAAECEAEIAAMLEGPLDLEELDLLSQQRLSGLTEQLLQTVFRPNWMWTETNLNHAKLFFANFKPVSDETPVASVQDESAQDDSAQDDPQQLESEPDEAVDDTDQQSLAEHAPARSRLLPFQEQNYAESVLDFFTYVLLDFATVDRSLEDASLAHAIAIARVLGLEKRMATISRKELRMRKKQYEQFAKRVDEIIEQQ